MADFGMKENGNDQAMVCTICLEMYRDPKNLQCGHSFCSGCVSGLPNRDIKCPICQYVTKVPPNGLAINYALREVIEKWKEDDAWKLPCAECTDKRSSLDEFWPCHWCQVEFVCFKCVVKNHRSDHHDLQPMTDVLKGRQDQLSELRRTVEASLTEIGDHVKPDLKTIDDRYQKIQSCLRNEIHPYFEDALRQINMEREEILTKTTSVHSHQLLTHDRMQELLTEVPARVESLKTLCGSLKEMTGRMEDAWKQMDVIVDKLLTDMGNRGVGTIRFELNSVSSIGRLIECCSPEYKIRGLPWMITVKRIYQFTHLGFYLRCKGLGNEWACRADMTFRLLSQKEGIPHRERRASGLFSTSDGARAGFADFIELKELMDDANGYIKNDAVILEVLAMAGKPAKK